MRIFRTTVRTLALLAASLLSGCGGGGGSGSGTDDGDEGGDGGTGPLTVEESLQQLGVGQGQSPRVDALGNALPANWAPLGATAAVNRLDELFLRGEAAEGGNNVFEWADLGPSAQDRFKLLRNFDGEFWAQSYFRDSTAAAGDFDRDGREELLVVTLDDDASPSPTVLADLLDDAIDGYAPLASLVVAVGYPRRVAAVAGDFDGDGAADAAIAVVYEEGVDICLLKYERGALRRIGRTVRVDRQSPVGLSNVILAAGQLDTDAAAELAYVYNEGFTLGGFGPSPSALANGSTRFGILDDALADLAALAGGPVSAAADGTPRTAKAADVALADIDADGYDEVVLGGLTRFGHPDASTGTTMGYLLFALDDADHGFAPLPARFEPYSNRDVVSAPGSRWIEHAHLEAVDLDGDTLPEIQLAESIYGFDAEEDAWERIAELPFAETMFPDSTSAIHVSPSSTRVAAGRIIERAQENLLTYSRDLSNGLCVWGLPGGRFDREDAVVDRLVLKDRMADVGHVQTIQPVDLDADSIALEYVDGSHRLLFTEPIVLAVLSAAPYGEGQDPDDSRTQFGVAESTGTERESSFSMTAGVVVGAEFDPDIPFVNLSVEDVFTITETVEKSTAHAYEVTETVEWETGPAEDSVIFTSIPYDQYRYRIVEPGTEEGLRGREIVVSVPRRPVQLMVSRAFYDAHVPDAGDRIDAAALPHVAGEPRSYYTRPRAFDIITARGGIASEERGVGQGSGSITVTLEVGEAHTEGQSIVSSWSGEVRATLGGLVAGFSVGESELDSVRLTTGKKLIYRGRVGHIDAAHVAENAYSFGLFAYPYRDADTGRSFEVLSYWVTPLR